MNQRHGGRILVDQLALHGCETVFCVPGESYLAALDGLHAHNQIRTIICRQEGGAAMMAEAYGKKALLRIGRKARFRDSDAVQQPSAALQSLLPEFQKVSGARRIAPFLTRERNRSRSFQVLLDGIDRLYADMD